MTILQIKVKPNARDSILVRNSDGTWQARIKSPPIEGRANEELVALEARHFAVPRARIAIKSGAAGRVKLVRIDDCYRRCKSDTRWRRKSRSAWL